MANKICCNNIVQNLNYKRCNFNVCNYIILRACKRGTVRIDRRHAATMRERKRLRKVNPAFIHYYLNNYSFPWLKKSIWTLENLESIFFLQFLITKSTILLLTHFWFAWIILQVNEAFEILRQHTSNSPNQRLPKVSKVTSQFKVEAQIIVLFNKILALNHIKNF